MFDHIGLRTACIEPLKPFYIRTFQSFGGAFVTEYPGGAGFGCDGQPAFWLGDPPRRSPAFIWLFLPVLGHLCILQGGRGCQSTDNGKSGVCADYHPDYCGAFLLDLDGNNAEAVYHLPYQATNLLGILL